MGIFRLPRFLRRFVRRRMNPVTEDTAWTWKSRLSVLYALLAWNGAGYVLYQIGTGNAHWPTTKGIRAPEEDMGGPAAQWMKTFGIRNAKVIHVSASGGISKTQEMNVPLEGGDAKKA